jgi:general secretion pathway protein D
VSQQNTGVILHVVPRVNKSGTVILDIDQEVSAVSATTSSGIDSPTIQERKISTSVAVHDGDTIALGGLITDNRTKSRTGIPFLSRIPFLGALFRDDDDSVTRTELIMFLKPRVIRDPDEMHGVMGDLQAQFNSIRPEEALQGKPDGP